MTQKIDFNDENSNTSNNPSFDAVLQARLSRRGVLLGGVGSVGSVMLCAAGLAASGAAAAAQPAGAASGKLGFKAVAKSLADTVIVPAGYTASVLYALGDPLTGSTAAYKNDGTDTDYENRAGDHHDGMEWFGLDKSGKPSLSSVDHGLLAVNHEATTDEKLSSFFLHANGGASTLPRPASEVDKETAIHGVSVVEVKKTGKMGHGAGIPLELPPDRPQRQHADHRPRPRQRPDGHQAFARRHQNPWHAEQLRHRQDALGHLPDR
jgi:hypothetical protein